MHGLAGCRGDKICVVQEVGTGRRPWRPCRRQQCDGVARCTYWRHTLLGHHYKGRSRRSIKNLPASQGKGCHQQERHNPIRSTHRSSWSELQAATPCVSESGKRGAEVISVSEQHRTPRKAATHALKHERIAFFYFSAAHRRIQRQRD